jgi:transmembrane sensor
MEESEFPLQDELLIKYLTGEANEEERREVLDWIHQNNTHQRYFDQLRDIYEVSKTVQPETEYKTDLSWEKVKSMYYKRRFNKLHENNNEDRLYFIREIFKYAALILALITIGFIGYRFLGKSGSNKTQLVWNIVEAPFGSRSTVSLSDGSKVWLNAGSTLKYSNDFGNKIREVFLEGEAYFDVAKFKQMQFIVRTGYVNVNVYGTEFNVKAYPEENVIQTTLVRGLITINGDPSKSTGLEKEIYLKPNQSITYIKDRKIFLEEKARKKESIGNTLHKDDNLLLLPKIDPVIYTSWKDNRWIIQSEQLSDLAIKLERRYNVKFQFNSASLKNYKFSGILRDETLEQVLELMELSAPIRFSIHEKLVYLDENKSFKKTYDELLMDRTK